MVTFHKGGSTYVGMLKSMKKKRVVKILPDGTEKRSVSNLAFIGCGVAVKALRVGFENLQLKEHTDALFTARLMQHVHHIYNLDVDGEKGKKSILFSQHKELLTSLNFKLGVNNVEFLQKNFSFSHADSRLEATLILEEFQNLFMTVQKSADCYRIYHYLCVISDYAFSEVSQKYEALSESSGVNAVAYSEYTPLYVKLNDAIVCSLPEGTVLSDADSVIHCVGFEYYYKMRDGFEAFLGGSGIKVVEVF
jgi:hypothetical protein